MTSIRITIANATRKAMQQLLLGAYERGDRRLVKRITALVCKLLHTLGFSYQKAGFKSDHLDPEARRRWLEETWPAILRIAREKEALIL